MIQKTIVCLANSKKLGARCVAGVEEYSREWIRPVGSGDHGAVRDSEQRYEDGTCSELLDVIELELLERSPRPGQPENWTLAAGQWRKAGHLADDHARDLLEALLTEEPAFRTNGRAVSVAEVEAGQVTSSLALIVTRTDVQKTVGYTAPSKSEGASSMLGPRTTFRSPTLRSLPSMRTSPLVTIRSPIQRTSFW